MATPEAEPGLRTVSSASGSAPSVSVGRGVKSRGGAAKVGVCDAEGEKVYHLPTLCEAYPATRASPLQRRGQGRVEGLPFGGE